MRYTALLFAIAIGIWPAVTACQSPPPNTLPAQLRAHLDEDRLGAVTSVRGLPLGVRDELQTLFGGATLDIADPEAAFRGSDGVVDFAVPTRRLVTAACSIDHCIVYYERGGSAHTWHIAVFHWTPAETRFEWGGIAPGGLRSIDELRKVMQSGSIKASSSW